MFLKSVELLNIDKINKNNIMYPLHTVQKMIDNQKEQYLGIIGVSQSDIIDLSEVAYIVNNLNIVDDKLIGDVTFADTPKGKSLQRMLEIDRNSITFLPCSMGTVIAKDEHKEVEDWTILSFNAINSDDVA